MVWLPTVNILVGGCFIKSLKSTTLGYIGEANIAAWPNAITQVQLKYPKATQVIPGHGKMGDLSLLSHTRQLAESALSNKL